MFGPGDLDKDMRDLKVCLIFAAILLIALGAIFGYTFTNLWYVSNTVPEVAPTHQTITAPAGAEPRDQQTMEEIKLTLVDLKSTVNLLVEIETTQVRTQVKTDELTEQLKTLNNWAGELHDALIKSEDQRIHFNDILTTFQLEVEKIKTLLEVE